MTQFRHGLLNIPLLLLLLGTLATIAPAQGQGPPQGQGQGRMGRMGMGGNQPQDMRTIHALFDNHKKISRTVKNIEKGVEIASVEGKPLTPKSSEELDAKCLEEKITFAP
jgi:hypothetical protein